MKNFYLLACLFFCVPVTFGQSVTLDGSVKQSEENQPVVNAVIALLTPGDSILYKFTRSDKAGKYQLRDVQAGDYILMTTHPYYADHVEDISLKANTTLPELALISKAKLLQEVIVKSGSPIKIKGDTTIYTADSFKVSANANVEELLRKLPGIQVGKDGEITAMGETVKKVLVDGEEFFGDDPGMAVKNLRADAVKEVQVFDKKSEQAEFTGIDDGQTQKTINLKLKEDRKKGYFGKIDLAGGPVKDIDARYNTNILFGAFKGKRKLSAYLLSGNTGQDGLSWQDEQKYGSSNDNITMNMDDDGNVMYIWRGSGDDDEPYVDPQNGYITNVNAGLLYSNKWNEKHSFNLSPKYNSQDYTNYKTTYTQTQIGDSVLNGNSDETIDVNRSNIKIRGIYDVKIDSNNTLKLTTNSNFYQTQSTSGRHEVTTGNFGTLKNQSTRELQTDNEKAAFSGNLNFKHKFAKARRTLSLTADWNMYNSNGKNMLKSTNEAYVDGMLANSLTLDQMKDYELSTSNLSANLVYTEPLSKEWSILLGYQFGYNYGTNDQLTYTYSPVSGKYDKVVDSLSNQFRQNIYQHVPSLKINFLNKKFRVNVGSGFGITQFNLEDLTFDKNYLRNYVNFFPSANLTYTYKLNRSIRLNYRGNTTQPTVNQLQPLRNNNDYFNQYIGNPNLKPSFTNNFDLSHHSYNFLTDMFMYQFINLQITENSITNNRIIDLDSGKTITQPINTNGNISFGAYTGFGSKIKKLDLRFNIGPSFRYNKYADYVNFKKSFSTTIAPGGNVWINKSKEKKYEFWVQEQLNFNSNTTSQNNTKIHFLTNELNMNGTVYMKKVWSISGEYQYYNRQRTLEGTSPINNHILNGRLQRTFKNDEFTAYFMVRDILNQNIGVDRNFYGNTYTEVINQRLKRYFMVGFTWNFKNKSDAPSQTPPTP